MINPIHRKLIFMFVPLVMGIIGLSVVIDDLKHPIESQDRCKLIGSGGGAQEFKQHAQLLYSRSGRWQDDIAMQCETMGDIIINDQVPLPLKPGQTVEIITKDFRYIPTRYYTNLVVVNPNEAERATLVKPETSKIKPRNFR